MKLRSIALALASAALTTGLTTGLASGPAQASTAQAGTAQAGRPATARPAHAGAQARALAALAGLGSQGGAPGSAAAGPRPRTGIITGFVQGTGGAPLAGACVAVSGPAGRAMAMTEPDGRYTIASVRPGTYSLHVSDCSAPGRYFDQGSGAGSWPATAPTVTVAAGHVSAVARVTLQSTASVLAHGVGVAASLGLAAGANLGLGTSPGSVPGITATARPARAGSSAIVAGTGAISGLVTGRGKPLADICVSAFPEPRPGRLRPDAGFGRYRIGGLLPGRYIVEFSPCSRTSNWLPQLVPGPDPARCGTGREG